MKWLLMICLLMSGVLMSQEGKKPERFNEAKSIFLSQLAKKKSLVAQAEVCVNAATNGQALKSCRKQHRMQMKNFHEESKKMREDFRQNKRQ